MASSAHLLSFEKNGSLPNIINVDHIKNITVKRTIVLIWALEICHVFKLKWEVWFHTVTLFDRCIEAINIPTYKIQLYAVTCICIAAKKYEILSPKLSDYVFICDGAVPYDDIIQTEKDILNIMNYNVELPNIMEYIRYISSTHSACHDVFILTRILCAHYLIYNVKVIPTILLTATYRISHQ